MFYPWFPNEDEATVQDIENKKSTFGAATLCKIMASFSGKIFLEPVHFLDWMPSIFEFCVGVGLKVSV